MGLKKEEKEIKNHKEIKFKKKIFFSIFNLSTVKNKNTTK